MKLPVSFLAIAVAFCLTSTANAESITLDAKCKAKVQAMNEALAQTLLVSDLPALEVKTVSVDSEAKVGDFGLTIAEGSIEVSMVSDGKTRTKQIKTATTLVSSEGYCAIMGIAR